MKLHFESALEPIGIDEKNGVIRGAVACTADVVARGHNLRTDTTLLHQLLESAITKGDKLPVHLDHKSGAAGVIGTAQAFRLTDGGQKLRCDVHLFKSHDRFKQVMELLRNLHETAGLSASFVGEAENGRARCSDFLATDLVVFPAANPTGLFSRGDLSDDDQQHEGEEMEPMNIEETLDAILDAQGNIDERLTAIEDALEGIQDDAGCESNEDETDDDQDAVLDERGARGGPHKFAASGYRLSSLGSAMQSVEFAEKVEALRLTGLNEKTAWIRVAQNLAREVNQPLNL